MLSPQTKAQASARNMLRFLNQACYAYSLIGGLPIRELRIESKEAPDEFFKALEHQVFHQSDAFVAASDAWKEVIKLSVQDHMDVLMRELEDVSFDAKERRAYQDCLRTHQHILSALNRLHADR